MEKAKMTDILLQLNGFSIANCLLFLREWESHVIINLYYLIIGFLVIHSLSKSFKNRNYGYLLLIHGIFIVFPMVFHYYFMPYSIAPPG